MGLSCSCEEFDWYYQLSDSDFSANSSGVCYGCGGDIKVGDEVGHIYSYEFDENGDETEPKTIGRVCESCVGVFYSLNDLGFCLTAEPGFIRDALREYQTEFVPARHKIQRVQ